MINLRRHPFGFTLIELMMTLAIASVLIGIAVPTFRDLSIRNRISTYTNDLIATINYARSEAVRRGTPISICASNNEGASCSGTWSDGWIVFSDLNGDAVLDLDDEETVLKASGPIDPTYSIGADAVIASAISYRSDGSATSSGVFAICHDDSPIDARAVIVTRLRPRVARDTDGDHVPNMDDTNNIDSCASPSGL